MRSRPANPEVEHVTVTRDAQPHEYDCGTMTSRAVPVAPIAVLVAPMVVPSAPIELTGAPIELSCRSSIPRRRRQRRREVNQGDVNGGRARRVGKV